MNYYAKLQEKLKQFKCFLWITVIYKNLLASVIHIQKIAIDILNKCGYVCAIRLKEIIL